MKKIYLITISILFISNFALAIQAPRESDWKKELNLSISQQKKINKIEQKAQKEYNEIFIKYVYLRGCEKDKEREQKNLEIKKKTDKKIMKVLNFSQKAKYAEIQSRIY